MVSKTSSESPADRSSTEQLIRSVMVEQKTENQRKAFPTLEPADAVPMPSNDIPYEALSEPQANSHAKPRKAKRTPGTGMLSLRGYRPKKSHIFWVIIALVFILRPWLIPGLIFLGFWVGLIVYLTAGPDRLEHWFQSVWAFLERKSPERANRLRQRADAIALRLDSLLDKLPDSWAEKLALPDFANSSTSASAFDDRPDPFDRLKTPEVYRG